MFLSVLLCAVCASVGSSSPLPPAPAPFLAAAPIWSPANLSTQFALLRSPEFKLRGDVDAATLYFAAEGSPRPPAGTTQAKLLGAAMIYVNGVLIGGGPGHNVPTASQVVRGSDIKPYLRPNGEVGAFRP